MRMRMRMRSAFPAFVVAVAGLAACHGASDPAAESAQADTSVGVCDPAHPDEAVSRLEGVKLVPPRLFGQVDPAGGPWSDLVLDDMERVFCASDPISEDEQTITAGWGTAPDYAVSVQYFKNDHHINFLQLNAGYRGTLDFASRPSAFDDPTKPNPFGQHTYSIGVGREIQRDGQPFVLDWQDRQKLDAETTELFDALMFTFAPELSSTQKSCKLAGLCLSIGDDGDGGAEFGARPLGMYLHVATSTATPSVPDYLYAFPVKVTPFSITDSFLKVDAEGPVATAADIGSRHARCVMKLGMTFSSFLADCVDVQSDPQSNATFDKMILGSATRTVAPTGTPALQAWWSLGVTGVHPDFASERFDEQAPPPNAAASGLVFDDRSSGRYLNDYSADGQTNTAAGSGAVYREYARLVQAFLHAQMDPALPRLPLGLPPCVLPSGANAAGWHPARGCTGIEQLVTPADPSTSTDPGVQRLSLGAAAAATAGVEGVFRPGEINVAFCPDPNDADHCNTVFGGVFGDTRAQVIAVLGNGDASSLPAAVRDRKAYVRLWAKALVKYLLAASQSPADLSDPKFDALTPADSDITIESIQGEVLSVKYKDKLELQLNYLSSDVSRLIFH
jgi:hypothetical protein